MSSCFHILAGSDRNGGETAAVRLSVGQLHLIRHGDEAVRLIQGRLMSAARFCMFSPLLYHIPWDFTRCAKKG